ncbi:MAG: cation transporter ['Candidatus Kapabacteria' thiocyanatum]|uniref:Uncharacterized protein n=1 Tax=Candidatus Kapaibacterium thiocyanatum TaxID=1895771 RepID=A0A1M3L6R2_9BACT|nr:cation transporter ['Candidatus Kapabacteria' thiocyanatum]OJX61169.1 MAG: hypothetical protein BGO89_00830 ['Candidatus Kapabacteria' thiocyanatum]
MKPPIVETRAMNISLTVGMLMLGAKWLAYMLTGSVAIFSDAAESVVHIIAVVFASYSLRVMYRPPDDQHHYGHEKIGFFSAGLEGGLIILAAGVIVVTAIDKLIHGVTLERIGTGAAITGAAGAVNACLGWYLVRTGRRENSLVIRANGKHILTDAWTSAGAVIGLLMAHFTGWLILDPILALLFGLNIIREGSSLMKASVNGLMDRTNEQLELVAKAELDAFCSEHDASYHRFRLRETGARVHIDFHMTFNDELPIASAHNLATLAEERLRARIPLPTEIFTHLEPTTLPHDHI